MKAILSICSLLCLSLSACCSLCPPEEKESCTCKSCESFGPTPGFNNSVSVTPTSPSQPAVWVAWNLNGNLATSGAGTVHSVWIGSDDEDVLVGTKTALQGVSYELKITNLENGPMVKMVNTSTGLEEDVIANPIDLSSEAFAVSVHQHPGNPDQFLLIVTAPNGGVKITLASAP